MTSARPALGDEFDSNIVARKTAWNGNSLVREFTHDYTTNNKLQGKIPGSNATYIIQTEFLHITSYLATQLEVDKLGLALLEFFTSAEQLKIVKETYAQKSE